MKRILFSFIALLIFATSCETDDFVVPEATDSYTWQVSNTTEQGTGLTISVLRFTSKLDLNATNFSLENPTLFVSKDIQYAGKVATVTTKSTGFSAYNVLYTMNKGNVNAVSIPTTYSTK